MTKGFVQDAVVATRNGWVCFVNGEEFGPWRTRNEAIIGMEVEQRRAKRRANLSDVAKSEEA